MEAGILANEFLETSFFSTSSKNAYQRNTDRMGTEQNRYQRDTEQIKKGTGTCVEQQQNALYQAFPVRFLLIGTVKITLTLSPPVATYRFYSV